MVFIGIEGRTFIAIAGCKLQGVKLPSSGRSCIVAYYPRNAKHEQAGQKANSYQKGVQPEFAGYIPPVTREVRLRSGLPGPAFNRSLGEQNPVEK
jgi:hypothetical protein